MKLSELQRKLDDLATKVGPDNNPKVYFYDAQYEYVYWDITDIEVDEDGHIILSDKDFI